MKKLEIDDFIACVFLVITITVVIVNVSMRYFFNAPLKSAEEIATICFIWSIFVGGASCYRKHMHMGIDILTHLFPKSMKKYLELFINIVVSIIIGVIFYLSVTFSIGARFKPTPVLGISSLYENASLIVGFGLIFIYSVNNLIKSIKTIAGKKGDMNV